MCFRANYENIDFRCVFIAFWRSGLPNGGPKGCFRGIWGALSAKVGDSGILFGAGVIFKPFFEANRTTFWVGRERSAAVASPAEGGEASLQACVMHVAYVFSTPCYLCRGAADR